jgi:hypothetical protein
MKNFTMTISLPTFRVSVSIKPFLGTTKLFSFARSIVLTFAYEGRLLSSKALSPPKQSS